MNRKGYFAAAGAGEPGGDLWTPADNPTPPLVWCEIETVDDVVLANNDTEVATIIDRSANGNDLIKHPSYGVLAWDATELAARKLTNGMLYRAPNFLYGSPSQTTGYVGVTVMRNDGNGQYLGFGTASNYIGINSQQNTSEQLRFGIHGYGSGQYTANSAVVGKWSLTAHRQRPSVGLRYRMNGGADVTMGNGSPNNASRDSRYFVDTAGNGLNVTGQWFKATCYFPEDDYDDAKGLTAKLEGYFAHKYGFADQLVAGHPYKDNPPTKEV